MKKNSKNHHAGRIISLLIVLCMVLSLVPTVAYADVVIINGDPINVKIKDYSVDKSSISVDLFVIFRNKETGEEQPREGIDTITPENVTVGTFKTVKTNAIEEAKTKLNEWLERMRQANPDVQFTVVGDIVVEGDDAEFDNRTYTMKSDGDDDIIIGDEASGNTTGGSQTAERYMEVNGDYGKTGNYTVTVTVEVKQAASEQTTPTGGKEIELIEINNATLDYNVGDEPQATAQVIGDAAEHCAIEYEYWEEIDENGKPLAFWYSDESQYNPNMQKITAFEAGKTYTYSFVVKAEKGYVFGDRATLKINDNVVSDPITMNPPLFPEARIVGEQIKTVALPYYQVIEGANSAWTQNSDGTLVFRANGDFSKFTGVKIDGTLIDVKNYTAVSGSTVITLKADYLNTLSVGTHKLTVVYTDGECSTNFEVNQAASEQTKPTEGDKTETTTPTEEDKTETTTPTGGKDTTNPKTGDNSNMLLWFAILFVCGAGVFGTAALIRKKRYSEN